MVNWMVQRLAVNSITLLDVADCQLAFEGVRHSKGSGPAIDKCAAYILSLSKAD